MTTTEAWGIKKKTDEIYNKWRNVNKESASAEQMKAYNADMETSNKLWRDFYAGITPEVKRMAYDAVTGFASIQTPSTPRNGTQAPSLNSATGQWPSAASNLPPSVSANLNLDSIVTPPLDLSIPQPAQARNTRIDGDTAVDVFDGIAGLPRPATAEEKAAAARHSAEKIEE